MWFFLSLFVFVRMWIFINLAHESLFNLRVTFCQKVIHSKFISRKQIIRCRLPIRPILFIHHVLKIVFTIKTMWEEKHELPISRDSLMNSNGNDIFSRF